NPAAVFTKSDRDARSSSDRRDFIGYVLSAHHDICAAEPAAPVYDLWNRRVFNRHPRCDVAFGAIGSVVHRAPVVALDLLDWCAAGDRYVAMHLPRDSSPAATHRSEARNKLAGILVLQPGFEPG